MLPDPRKRVNRKRVVPLRYIELESMKLIEPISLTLAQSTDGRKLLCGRSVGAIAAGAWFVLIKEQDAYQLRVIEPEADKVCPSSLASFLPVEVVDEIERLHALDKAAPPVKRQKRGAKTTAQHGRHCAVQAND